MKQVVVYFLLAFFISWLIWLPLYATAMGLRVEVEIPFNHALGGLGPALAAVIVTGVFKGRSALTELLKKCISFSDGRYFLIALLVPYALLFFAITLDAWLNNTEIVFSAVLRSKEFPALSYFSIFFFNLLFFGFGEEAGWRGFALPRMQVKWNALTSSLLLTLFWAVWHLPLFFYRPGYVEMGIGGIAGWFLSLLTGSILLTWLYNSSRGSILICAIFHATIDMVFTADVRGVDTITLLGVMVTLWGVVILMAFKAKNLSNRDRVTSQTQ